MKKPVKNENHLFVQRIWTCVNITDKLLLFLLSCRAGASSVLKLKFPWTWFYCNGTGVWDDCVEALFCI